MLGCHGDRDERLKGTLVAVLGGVRRPKYDLLRSSWRMAVLVMLLVNLDLHTEISQTTLGYRRHKPTCFRDKASHSEGGTSQPKKTCSLMPVGHGSHVHESENRSIQCYIPKCSMWCESCLITDKPIFIQLCGRLHFVA